MIVFCSNGLDIYIYVCIERERDACLFHFLFNRFAQSAGPGLYAPSDEGTNGRKNEVHTVEGRCGKGLRRTCQRKASTHILKGTRDKGKHLWKDGGTNRCMGWRKEGKNESVKRRRERSQKWAKRGRKIKHRPQNLLKKGAEIDQNRARIDARGSQNEDKTNKKSKQPRQDDLGHPLGAISRLSCYSQVPSWVPKSSQIRKKSDAKNRWFFLSPLEAKKVRKRSPSLHL